MFERPFHLQVLAVVVEHMELGRIEIDAALDVADEGVVGPRIPQAGDDVVELARPRIALVVLHLVVHAEVLRRIGIGRGHDVPAGAALRDVIERGEAAGDGVGRLEGGRGGGDQAEMLGVLRQRRQQGQRIERGDGGRALQRLHRHVQHRQVIGHEESVELAALQGLGVGDQRLEIEVGVRRAARIAPGGGVDADRAHEGAEAELFLGHDLYLAPARPFGKAGRARRANSFDNERYSTERITAR